MFQNQDKKYTKLKNNKILHFLRIVKSFLLFKKLKGDIIVIVMADKKSYHPFFNDLLP
jgi:hypothetical protein